MATGSGPAGAVGGTPAITGDVVSQVDLSHYPCERCWVILAGGSWSAGGGGAFIGCGWLARPTTAMKCNASKVVTRASQDSSVWPHEQSSAVRRGL